MRRPRVARIFLKDLRGDGRRPHVDSEVTTVVRCAEQRQSVKGRDVVVVGILLVHPPHGVAVGEITAVLVALAVQRLDGGEPIAFLVAAGFRRALRRRWRQPAEGGECCVAVLLLPDRVVVRHRLAPVGHGESGVGALGLAEGLAGGFVLEAVHEQNAVDEVLLRRRRPGGREVDGAELGLLRRGERCRRREYNEDREA